MAICTLCRPLEIHLLIVCVLSCFLIITCHFYWQRTTKVKVAGKYQDILTLESSIAELHQMCLDFALLTEEHGNQLDQIEFQIQRAGDFIDDGNDHVVDAIKYQEKINKKRWYVHQSFRVRFVLLCNTWPKLSLPLLVQLDYSHCSHLHHGDSTCNHAK